MTWVKLLMFKSLSFQLEVLLLKRFSDYFWRRVLVAVPAEGYVD